MAYSSSSSSSYNPVASDSYSHQESTGVGFVQCSYEQARGASTSTGRLKSEWGFGSSYRIGGSIRILAGVRGAETAPLSASSDFLATCVSHGLYLKLEVTLTNLPYLYTLR